MFQKTPLSLQQPLSPPLTLGGTVLKESYDLLILSDYWFDDDFFEVSSLGFQNSSQRLGILRKTFRAFNERLLIGRCFPCFVLPVLEYCCAVWCSAFDAQLKLVDRVVIGENFLTLNVCSFIFMIYVINQLVAIKKWMLDSYIYLLEDSEHKVRLTIQKKIICQIHTRCVGVILTAEFWFGVGVMAVYVQNCLICEFKSAN